MSFLPANNPCPCESGLDFHVCCGNAEGCTINIGKINFTGECDSKLTDELYNSIKEITQTPDMFPVAINPLENNATLIKMSPFWFNESIFLNQDRIMGKCAINANLQWLKEKADHIKYQATPMIFHTAFCGSTILSRAQETVFQSLSLREPDVLATLLNYSLYAHVRDDLEVAWYRRVLALLSRRFEQDEPIIVKANDYANPIVSKLLKYQPTFPVLLMYTPLEQFIVSCIKHDLRKQWISERFQQSVFNIKKTFGDLDILNNITPDEFCKMAAVYWAYSIAFFIEANKEYPERIKSLDFNDMLKSPKATVEAFGKWFNLSLRSGINVKYEVNYLLSEYSKNPGQKYSPIERNSEIQAVLAENTDQITQSMAIAKTLLGDKYPEHGLPNALLDI